MSALGSVSGRCHAGRMVAMEIILNFYKYNCALYKILINKPLEQCAASLIHMNQDWVVAYESLKTKGKVQLGNSKWWSRALFLLSLSHSSNGIS